MGTGLCLVRKREALNGFYLVHTHNCHCRIKTNITCLSILLFNDTEITAPDDKICLENLYHVRQLNCCLIFLYFFASSVLSYPNASALTNKNIPFILFND